MVKKEYRGCSYYVRVEPDHDLGPPWAEHDGHGPVSDWKRKEEKRPGQVVLHRDRDSYRFYDWEAAVKLAKRDCWGLDDEAKAELALRLRKPVEWLTRGETIVAAVQRDFDYLQAWCKDEWQWQWFAVTVYDEEGELLGKSSLGGFAGETAEEDALEAASEEAKAIIDGHIRGQELMYYI